MSKGTPNTRTFNGDTKDVVQMEDAAKHLPRVSSDHEKQVQESRPLDVDPVFSLREQRKIIHKVDKRLVYVLGLMYCVSLMDRVNLPNAAISGMNVNLDMNKRIRYSTVRLVFFITYTPFQPSATILTRKFGPRLFLPGLCVAWGAVMVGFGFVHKWITLIPLRLFLGLLEAGYSPGYVYLLSAWYARYDQQRRSSLFYLLSLAAAGASGILAYGMSKTDGLAGHAGWRWIFIMYGIITMMLSVLGYSLVVDFPGRCKQKKHWGFLTDDEIDFIMASQANNIRGHWKRAFTSATLIEFGGIGGIAGSLMFRTRDVPKYHLAVYLSLAFNFLIVILVCINTVFFRYENKKADRGGKVLEGDVNFRYTI
ncbi:hypothetical protein AC579_8586 [Pseudocercospora musae]|uniref:Major facilitator superfamily (MFS) profile domain-containing protein n=1 Tax=Pseudocercospora musae TaxID=113226 RepID=A0A139IAY0_9PEZI|nr:hypothetical protein AC579_8586 [Pseudocercospora musae]